MKIHPGYFSKRSYERKKNFLAENKFWDIINFRHTNLKIPQREGQEPPIVKIWRGTAISSRVPCDEKGRGEPNLPRNARISPSILLGRKILRKTGNNFFQKQKIFRTLSFFGHAFKNQRMGSAMQRPPPHLSLKEGPP